MNGSPQQKISGGPPEVDGGVPTAGFLIVDKPFGLSSARAVARVKGIARRAGAAKRYKVGHAGTLDPAATGVLVILLGKATKQCERLMGMPKTYTATVRLGATTATDDAEADPVPWPNATPPDEPTLRAALGKFVGEFDQVPPNFSAVKVGGRRAYAAARSGESITIEPKRVRCDRLDLVRYAWPEVELEMDTGRGFYVRSLARDLGVVLDTGGHLTALRRTRVGNFRIADAVDLETLDRDGLGPHVLGEVPA
ncbi:MAG: tRNA pseudouridine(55) synthase TruB [Planctomycetota bacterium]